jgi:hypothetical protein
MKMPMCSCLNSRGSLKDDLQSSLYDSRMSEWSVREVERSFLLKDEYIYIKVWSGQTSKRGEGILLYPLTQMLPLGCQRLGLVRMRARLVRMKSF